MATRAAGRVSAASSVSLVDARHDKWRVEHSPKRFTLLCRVRQRKHFFVAFDGTTRNLAVTFPSFSFYSCAGVH
jgi:hypothetical protein